MQNIAVEAYEWLDPEELGEVAEKFAQAQLLVTLFDGNPDKWIEFIETRGTAAERERDLPYAQEVKRRMHDDPQHVERLRQHLLAIARLL